MLYAICCTLSRLLFKILFAFEVTGLENIPEEGTYIIAGNHASFLDPIAIGAALPYKVSFIAREDLFDLPFLGWLFPKINVFPVKRDSGDLRAIRQALERVRKGESMVIFPEGRRSVDGAVGEGKWGVGFLAIRGGVDVIPVSIVGGDKAMPRGARFIRPHKLSVHFGRPIAVKDYTGLRGKEAYLKLSDAVMKDIREIHRRYS